MVQLFTDLKLQELTGEVWERIGDSIPHFVMYVITYPCIEVNPY